MPTKNKPGQQPPGKGTGGSAEGKAMPSSVRDARPEGIFGDNRSGRDRREEGPKVDDPRRVNPERRSSKSQSAWWLERDYVESHHFLQKSSAGRPPPDDSSS